MTTLERELELSILATSYGTKSTRQQFTEPLSLTDQKYIEWLADRYEGKDSTPVMTFACDGVLTLIVPGDLRRKREPLNTEAQLIHTRLDARD